MKFNTVILGALGVRSGLGIAVPVAPRDEPPAALGTKVQVLEAKYFKELGAKRVKITYGPMLLPGADDATTHGMQGFPDRDVLMPCRECLITGFTTDLQWEDGSTANANKGVWLHHTGLMNLNRTDASCPEWPERINVNGNERSPFDMTVKGTRKAGYYVRKTDQIFLQTEVMNYAQDPRLVYLAMEWEYVEGIPDGFDIVTPVWLDVKGNCLTDLPAPAGPNNMVFNVTMGAAGYSPNFTGELFLIVPHIHDGNTKQEVYIDGKLVCQNVPGYGETEAFVTHEGMYGHEHEHGEEPGHEHGGGEEGHHDHGSDDHILHVSSITQCVNLGKVGPGNKITVASWYNMTEHKPMKDHDGSLEPIMGIAFLHFARPKDEVLKDILAMKGGSVEAFLARVAENDAKEHAQAAPH
ncbi:hypothetical protein B0H66DRAFT_537761 [Apodospora peruviana]|uniref:Uncharacterized protein n=1 Tax=Apodospora peruviana TaxID=516989 RepID=A0AAE0LYR9_9PEZI|nr:hypothetical protein B0H66DRAFT_537761 [Apodospora peruviana]